MLAGAASSWAMQELFWAKGMVWQVMKKVWRVVGLIWGTLIGTGLELVKLVSMVVLFILALGYKFIL